MYALVVVPVVVVVLACLVDIHDAKAAANNRNLIFEIIIMIMLKC